MKNSLNSSAWKVWYSLLIVIFIIGCGEPKTTESKNTEKQEEAIQHIPRIASHAVIPITKESYPKLYKKWGKAGVDRINELMPLAAKKVSESPECDEVDYVEISQERSISGKKIVFFVDCRNRKRFYVDESDLRIESGVLSQTKKMSSISDADAIKIAEAAVKSELTNPLSYKRKFGSTSVYRAETTGNIVVQFEFEAKNTLGNVLPHKARCIINDQGSVDVSLTKE